MTKLEKVKCEKLMEEAIQKAKAANEDFSNYNVKKMKQIKEFFLSEDRTG